MVYLIFMVGDALGEHKIHYNSAPQTKPRQLHTNSIAQVFCARQIGQRAAQSAQNGARVRPRRFPFSIFVELR